MKLALDLGAVWEHCTMPEDWNSKNHLKSFQAVLSVMKACLRRECCGGKNNKGHISLKPYTVCFNNGWASKDVSLAFQRISNQ